MHPFSYNIFYIHSMFSFSTALSGLWSYALGLKYSQMFHLKPLKFHMIACFNSITWFSCKCSMKDFLNYDFIIAKYKTVNRFTDLTMDLCFIITFPYYLTGNSIEQPLSIGPVCVVVQYTLRWLMVRSWSTAAEWLAAMKEFNELVYCYLLMLWTIAAHLANKSLIFRNSVSTLAFFLN